MTKEKSESKPVNFKSFQGVARYARTIFNEEAQSHAQKRGNTETDAIDYAVTAWGSIVLIPGVLFCGSIVAIGHKLADPKKTFEETLNVPSNIKNAVVGAFTAKHAAKEANNKVALATIPEELSM